MRFDRRRYRSNSCKPIIPTPTVCFFLLLLSIGILHFDSSLSFLAITKTTTVAMAWSLRHRSFWNHHRLSSRLLQQHRSSSLSSSVLFFTKPSRGAVATIYGSDSSRQGWIRRRCSVVDHQRKFRRAFGDKRAISSSTRLYGYQDFLNQEGHEKILVSYFTDIEGDKFYLDRYVDNSKILTWRASNNNNNERDDDRNNDENPEKLSLYYYSTTKEEEEDSSSSFFFPYERRIEFCQPNGMLVFGGDLWDKGGFDLYVARQLLDLKRRYPNRVVWVLGNRDINKIRMSQELGLPIPTPSCSATPPRVPYHPGLFWFKGSGRIGDPEQGNLLPSMVPGERLRWILGNTMGSPDAMEHRRRELLWEKKGCREDNSRCIAEDDSIEEEISDIDVVRSYQESCHPRGEMGRFLSEGLLAARVGPILIVHGSLPLTDECMAEAKGTSIWDDLTFCMPWLNKTHHDYGEGHRYSVASDLGVNTIEDWLDAVNEFCAGNVEAWKNHVAQIERSDNNKNETGQNNGGGVFDDREEEESKNSVWAYRAGYGNGPSYSGTHYADLIQYGMGRIPGGKKNPTVVYNSFTPQGMPAYFLPPEEEQQQQIGDNNGGNHPSSDSTTGSSDVATCTREFFKRSSVRLILTGHKPQGDMPSPIRVDKSSWVICADTSYSGDTKWFHDERNATTNNAEIVEHRRQLQEERRRQRRNLGRGKSISFRGETAVSEVLVELSSGATSLESIRYHGVLSDGTEYESVDLLLGGGDDDDDGGEVFHPHNNNNGQSRLATNPPAGSSSIGRVAPFEMVPDPSDSPHEGGRWWTKGICLDGSRLYYAGEGYNIWNYVISPPPDNEISPNQKE